MYHIYNDGSGTFPTIQAALDSVPRDNHNPVLLYIHAGVYRERLTITSPHITLMGDGPEKTVIVKSYSAREILADGSKRGTFRSYTCLTDTHDITFKNLTLENDAGPCHAAGQALALYADGDRLSFVNCYLKGHQDTLFTGPLPPREIEPGGFIGPKQFAPRINGRQYYKNCYIDGDIDFIFGSATAYFEDCEFFSINPERPGEADHPRGDAGHAQDICGYVTAASTPEGQAYGYVMKRCRFLTKSCPPSSVYLGRPWREYAKTVLIDCYMDRHIRPEGWHDWNKPQAHETTFYAEYGSYGPSGDLTKRPSWIRRLDRADLPYYEKNRVLGGWSPEV